MSGPLCPSCGEELPAELGCTATTIALAGHSYPVIPHDGPERCEGCGTTPGGHHHGDCPYEKCPRCGGLLADCGCVARMGSPTKGTEEIAWTIDEEQIASLSDSEAARAVDEMVHSMVDQITAAVVKTGAAPPDVTALRYNVATMMIVGLVRKLAERTPLAPDSSPASG